ncbi:DhNV_017 [Dikerogammarus haemobaphes nudivirus]|nr:DhNV_017 [Dikerogammarus haemobaphes nudivirus]
MSFFLSLIEDFNQMMCTNPDTARFNFNTTQPQKLFIYYSKINF